MTIKTFARNVAAQAPWGQNREALDAYKKAKDELNKLALERWDDPEFHRQVARDLEEIIDYGFESEALFNQYLDVSNVGEFDRPIIRERRGLKVFYTHRGGYIEESQLRDEIWTFQRDTLGFHISEFIDKLRAGFADTIESLVGLGDQLMVAEFHRRALGLMSAAVPAGAPNYTDATTGLTKTQVDTAISAVGDVLRPDGAGVPPITILGRAPMVDQIADFDHGFDPEANAEIRKKGMLGTYRGANVVRLHHYADEDGVAFVPANELWVFAGTVGKFHTFGGSQVKQWDENTADYRHYRTRKDFGGVVHHPEYSWRIVDGSKPA